MRPNKFSISLEDIYMVILLHTLIASSDFGFTSFYTLYSIANLLQGQAAGSSLR